MVNLHQQLNGAVNVYTMDHRGTGRSTLLDCVAAQATVSGTPWGKDFVASEVPACAQDLQIKYGDLASFSVTTAATDLATFISKFTNDASTIVYGVSYGTVLVERLIHLAPPKVTGYALDSVATASGAPANEFLFVSEWDRYYGEVGDTFLSLCDQVSSCKTHFETAKLNDTVQDLLDRFDKDPNSTCATLINHVKPKELDERPSSSLRYVLGYLLANSYTRTLIPPVAYRLTRCEAKDVNVLKRLVTVLRTSLDSKTEDDTYRSSVLFNLIDFSELWEMPMPSKTEMLARYTGAKVSDSPTFSVDSLYCAYSKENSSVCDELGVGNYDANPILYARDQYWNKSATIPSNASVLLLSGKLDPQTPNKYAKSLLHALDGDNKELITFDYAAHGIVGNTPVNASDPSGESCGMKLLASYVHNNGDLRLLDKSCVGQMPPFTLKVPTGYLHYYLSTDDAYDGVYNANLSSQQ